MLMMMMMHDVSVVFVVFDVDVDDALRTASVVMIVWLEGYGIGVYCCY